MANTLARVDKRAARAAVIRTRQVATKTTLLLFRCRNVIEERKGSHQVVAEEMILWGWRGTPQQKEFLDHAAGQSTACVGAGYFGPHHPSAGGFSRKRAEATGLAEAGIRRPGRRAFEKTRRSARALQRANGHQPFSSRLSCPADGHPRSLHSSSRWRAKLRIVRELSEHSHRRRDSFSGYSGSYRRC